MNNRILLIIFLVLLAIYGITRLTSKQRQSSFDTELIAVDTARVSSVTIRLKDADADIILKREAGAWLVSNGQISTEAVPSAVEAILGALTEIQTKRIVAKNSEKWADYEVEDGAGTRVTVYDGEEVLEDFVVGRFNFNQQTRSGTSYVRIAGEDEVYAVDGFLTLTFSQGFDSYRDRTILKLDAGQEITSVRFSSPDTTRQLVKVGEAWQIDGAVPADSALVAQYINGLRNLSGSTFADDFDELQADDYRYRSVTINGNNLLQPLSITCYLDTTRTEEPFIIQSSQHPDVFFASDTTGVYERVFKDVEAFVGQGD